MVHCSELMICEERWEGTLVDLPYTCTHSCLLLSRYLIPDVPCCFCFMLPPPTSLVPRCLVSQLQVLVAGVSNNSFTFEIVLSVSEAVAANSRSLLLKSSWRQHLPCGIFVSTPSLWSKYLIRYRLPLLSTAFNVYYYHAITIDGRWFDADFTATMLTDDV